MNWGGLLPRSGLLARPLAGRVAKNIRSIVVANPMWHIEREFALRHPRVLPEGPAFHRFDPNDVPQFKETLPTPITRRIGVPAFKLGCMAMWDSWGVQHNITVCQMDRVYVSDHRNFVRDGFSGMVLTIGSTEDTINENHVSYYIKRGINPPYASLEFDCSPDCVLPTGTHMTARHFAPGQLVHVGSVSEQKSWQGVVKRYGFSGMHQGKNKKERSPGSIGQRGAKKVWAGTEMAGHTGGKPTMVIAKVFRINANHNLVYVTGSIPGPVGSVLRLFDGSPKRNKDFPIPHPTFIPTPGNEYPAVVDAPALPLDPFVYRDRVIQEGKSKG